MSKINAIRIINLNYNNNAIKISDEIFELSGESTLLSLQNGGGKSVLVQMVMAPFVHKRYQNAKDRPFSSYFTTNKPTFIMVEWKLDCDAGYVLAGMMVRKSQEIAEDNANELEIYNFICEYRQRCNLDIYHLPVVEKTKKEIVLKSFNACKQLFETSKRDHTIPFFYYDMNNSSQSKQYFDKLMEYQINYKEWENIIKKINLKESGLSDLFSDCKDEKGLVEKWFLDAVENKLNKEKNRMHEFQSIMEKYVIQYKDNQSKISRRDAIKVFQEQAKKLQEEAENYAELTREKSQQESRIADFIIQINQLLDAQMGKKMNLEQELQELLDEIDLLEYERISSEIYEIEKKIAFHASNHELIQVEKEDLERELEKITRHLQIFICAKQQEKVDEDKNDLQIEQQKLALCQEKEADLEPERNSLGSQLRCYYSELMDQKNKDYNLCETEINTISESLKEEKCILEQLGMKEKQLASEIGETRSDIKAFDHEENRFNRIYQEHYARNVLGQYEAGILSEKKNDYFMEFEQLKKMHSTTNRQLSEKQEQQKGLMRNIQDTETKKVRVESEIKAKQSRLSEYDQEIKERSIILRYFQIPEESLFHTDEIIQQTARKLSEMDVNRRILESEGESLTRELKKLTQGEVLELSDDFKKMLEDAGITPVYGMEWILKNKKSIQENQKLIQKNPFLPYALIMTKQELMKLSDQQEHIYTSSPVPILVREQLEQGELGKESAIRDLSGINFYVWFNENLLDQNKLQEMILAKSKSIENLQEHIERRKQEYQDYFAKQEKIRNQKVSLENYDMVKAHIDDLQMHLEQIVKNISDQRKTQEECEQHIKELQRQLTELEQDVKRQESKIADFDILCKAYDSYLNHRKLLEMKIKDQERLENQQKLSQDKSERLQGSLQTKSNERDMLQGEIKDCAQKRMRFEQYLAIEEKLLSEAAAQDAENRYMAITANISEEKQELEARVLKAADRSRRSVEELSVMQTKYHLCQDDWKNTTYDAKEELHQEILQEDHNKKIEVKNRQIQDEIIKIEKLKTENENQFRELKRQCNKLAPLEKSEIHVANFNEEIQKRKYSQSEITRNLQSVQELLRTYEELQAALAEYNDLKCGHPITWDCSFADLNKKELTDQKGILIRDYNNYNSRIQDKRGDLDRMLGRIARLEQFADAFYQKPIEGLMNLTQDALLFLKQLDTILQSFNNLMEKLLVDISFVEKEKEKVVELMEDYLKEVHSNLGKIDHNSTIMVREKPVKMLKIDLLDWTENENIFHLRMQDYVDEVTRRGIDVIGQNGNLSELLGTRITTNALYDAVAGIANVQIKMYKIEAQREYPITWADVAKNSGGEGFLSAFVILSSLLCYMRKNESDLFADRNEGKVLIMDNPFAQTNASHLLKPLMDMAKKSNTQLICLSGLGGESIYNRFDNIYVLNLIAANLRSGMQYLKADHIRGSEQETMITSQIQVLEQMELEF